MNDDPCVVTVNGTDYYCPCDYVDNLIVADGYLINTGSSTVTLYRSFPDYYTANSGYPRITCRSNTRAYLTQSYNSTGSTISVSSFDVKNRHTSNDVLLLIVLIGVTVLNIFKR